MRAGFNALCADPKTKGTFEQSAGFLPVKEAGLENQKKEGMK